MSMPYTPIPGFTPLDSGMPQEVPPQAAPQGLPSTPPGTDIPTLIQQVAAKYNIDPALAARLVNTESGGNPNAVSSAGAVGLTQVMPQTAMGLGVNPQQLTDPATSLDTGLKYFSQLQNQFGGDPQLAAAAYNAGPGTVADFKNGSNLTGKNPNHLVTGGIPPWAGVQNYVNNVAGGSAPSSAADSGSDSGDGSMPYTPMDTSYMYAPPATPTPAAAGATSGSTLPSWSDTGKAIASNMASAISSMAKTAEAFTGKVQDVNNTLVGSISALAPDSTAANISSSYLAGENDLFNKAKSFLDSTGFVWNKEASDVAAGESPAFKAAAALPMAKGATNASWYVEKAAEFSPIVATAALTGGSNLLAGATPTLAAAIGAGSTMIGQLGAAAGDNIMSLTPEQVQALPAYAQMRKQGVPADQIQKRLADQATRTSAGFAAATLAMDGPAAATLGKVIGSSLGSVGQKLVAMFAGSQIAGVSNAAMTLGQNAAEQQVNPSQSLTPGLGESYAFGTVLGAGLGALHPTVPKAGGSIPDAAPAGSASPGAAEPGGSSGADVPRVVSGEVLPPEQGIPVAAASPGAAPVTPPRTIHQITPELPAPSQVRNRPLVPLPPPTLRVDEAGRVGTPMQFQDAQNAQQAQDTQLGITPGTRRIINNQQMATLTDVAKNVQQDMAQLTTVTQNPNVPDAIKAQAEAKLPLMQATATALTTGSPTDAIAALRAAVVHSSDTAAITQAAWQAEASQVGVPDKLVKIVTGTVGSKATPQFGRPTSDLELLQSIQAAQATLDTPGGKIVGIAHTVKAGGGIKGKKVGPAGGDVATALEEWGNAVQQRIGVGSLQRAGDEMAGRPGSQILAGELNESAQPTSDQSGQPGVAGDNAPPSQPAGAPATRDAANAAPNDGNPPGDAAAAGGNSGNLPEQAGRADGTGAIQSGAETGRSPAQDSQPVSGGVGDTITPKRSAAANAWEDMLPGGPDYADLSGKDRAKWANAVKQDTHSTELASKIAEPYEYGGEAGDYSAGRVEGIRNGTVEPNPAQPPKTPPPPQTARWTIAYVKYMEDHGQLPQGTSALIKFLLDKNPALATDLNLKVSDGLRGNGIYRPLTKTIELLRKGSSAGTGVHELLHHTERMLPDDIRQEIRKAWAAAVEKEISAAVKDGNSARAKALSDMVAASARGDHTALLDALSDPSISPRDDYHFADPSEFWAVNGTRILAARQRVASWVQRARQWLQEFIQKLRGIAGMPSDSPILRGLDALTRVSGEMPAGRHMLKVGAADLLNARVDPDSPGSRMLASRLEDNGPTNTPHGLGYVTTPDVYPLARPKTMSATRIIALADKGPEAAVALRRTLKAQGHDGILVKVPGGRDRVVAFDHPDSPDDVHSFEDMPPRPRKQDTTREGLKNTATGVVRGTQGSVMTHPQLVETFGDSFPALKEFWEKRVWANDLSRRMMHPVEALDRRFRSLSKTDEKAFSKLDAEIAKGEDIAPDVPLSDPRNAHLMDKDGKVKPEIALRHAELAAQFDKLSDKAKQVYRDTQELFRNQDILRHETLVDELDRKLKDRLDAAEAAAHAALAAKAPDASAVVEKWASLKDAYKRATQSIRPPKLTGSYSPAVRYGDHITVGKSADYARLEKGLADGSIPENERAAARATLDKIESDPRHYFVKADKSPLSAAATRRELISKGFTDVQTKPKAQRFFQGAAESRVPKALRDLIDAQFEGKTRDALHQLFAEFEADNLPDNHASSRQLRKRGIAGFDMDRPKSIIDTASSTARKLTKAITVPTLRDHMHDMLRQAEDLDAEQGTHNFVPVANRVANDFESSLAVHSTPAEKFLTHVIGIKYLFASPMFRAQHLAQTPLFTSRELAAKHGEYRTARALTQASADAASMLKKSFNNRAARGLNWRQWSLDLDTLTQGKTGAALNRAQHEADMLKWLQGRGLLGFQIDHNLGITTKSGDVLSKYSPTAARGANYVLEADAMVTHTIESFNRASTALAAYRLALEGRGSTMLRGPIPPATDAAARAYAEKTVSETHVNYSEPATPPIMRPQLNSKVPSWIPRKMFFMFRRFDQAMLYLWARNLKDMVSSADRETQVTATRAFVGQSLSLVAVAGLRGVIGFNLAAALTAIASGLFGDPRSTEEVKAMWREWFAERLGSTSAHAVFDGLPTLGGIDVSGHFGLGELLSASRQSLDFSSGDALMLSAAKMATGATGSAISDLLDGVHSLMRGDVWNGASKIAPRGIANLAKAEQYRTEGIVSRKGVTTLPASALKTQDALWAALGVPTSVLVDRGDELSAKTAYMHRFYDEKQALINDIVEHHEIHPGDDILTPEFQKRLNTINDQYGRNGLFIGGNDISRALVRQTMQNMTLDESGVSGGNHPGMMPQFNVNGPSHP